MEHSSKPFSQTLDAILKERQISDRELARMVAALKHPEGTLSNPTVSALHGGRLVPAMRSMELIAKALKINPEVFAEYRLEIKRAKLDWRTVGLRKALNELAK